MAPIVLAGRIYFAGESLVWGGGMAFYDRDAKGSVAARAYLLTLGQFSDIAAQEMRRAPGQDLDLGNLGELGDEGLYRLGPGRYETIIPVGWRAGFPMLTITASSPNELPLAPPSRAYLSSIAAGLRESHGWTPTQIAEYLADAPGVAPPWSHEGLVAVADAAMVADPGPLSGVD